MMKKIPLNINVLLAACQKGDRESQMQLHRRFYSFGLNLCLRYARNREEAREMLNDGFLKVFLHLEKQKFEGPIDYLSRASRKLPAQHDSLMQFLTLYLESRYYSTDLILGHRKKLNDILKSIL